MNMPWIRWFWVALLIAQVAGGQVVRFAVVADPHYFAPELGTEGPAFDQAIASDRKLLREGPAILDSVISGILSLQPDFVLVPGDLTKDGERASHEQIAQRLDLLRQAGIPVLVAPGNHDISNPRAYGYHGNQRFRVPSISPDEFATIHRRHGYDSAIARDPHSLSYVAEPVPGLRVLSIDSCIYNENEALGYAVTGGRIKRETLVWVIQQLRQAQAEGVPCLAFMHHGLIAHADLQEVFFREYVIEGWRGISRVLAEAGLDVVFTGHFHAQEIVAHQAGRHSIIDVKTASLVTYPVAYRICRYDLRRGVLDVQSRRVQAIDFDIGGIPFQAYARRALEEAVFTLGATYLPALGFDLPPQSEAILLQVLSRFAVMHFDGDEQLRRTERTLLEQLATSPRPLLRGLGLLSLDLLTDRPPGDNTARLVLRPPK